MSSRDDRARIKRGTQPRKPVTVRKRVPASRKKSSSLSTALALIPDPVTAFAKQAAGWALVLAALGAIGAGFYAMKLPQMIGVEIGELVGKAGFRVNRIEITGIGRMERADVLKAVLTEQARAMPLVDLEGIRTRLMRTAEPLAGREKGWVAEARVSRRLPDTLVIDIVERTPHAVLRKPGRLVLIDAEGHELEPISAKNARGKLIISGPGAGQQVAELSTLLEAAPALKPQVKEAEWIGNRRWNLTFKTDQVLALPQGDKTAASALISFARLDGVNRLLGGKAVAFDMRAAERIYMRVPGLADEAAERRKAQEKK